MGFFGVFTVHYMDVILLPMQHDMTELDIQKYFQYYLVG